MRQFAVLGLGQFGSAVTENLIGEGCEILVIDSDPDPINEIKNRVTTAVVAEATDRNTMLRFLSEGIDCVIISLGPQIEASILATLYAKEAGVHEIIAKANTPDHAKVLELVGATQVVTPSVAQAKRVVTSLVRRNIVDYLPLAEGFSVSEIKAPDRFVGKTLRQLDLRRKRRLDVIAVRHVAKNEGGTEELEVIPSPDREIRDGDGLLVIGRDTDIAKIKE
ncbi:MAG: TrkA family potassium uptake protein [Planctomycetota bacterium]